MSYETKNIRNVCLLGHGGSGKTTLAESMLYLTGAIDRQGKTADGNTVCDYDPEEIKRKITISTSIAPVNFGGCKINILDCPGFFDFAGDARCAMRAAEAGMIFCTAKDGIAVRRGALLEIPQEREHPLPVLHFQDRRGSRRFRRCPLPPCRTSTAAPSARSLRR